MTTIAKRNGTPKDAVILIRLLVGAVAALGLAAATGLRGDFMRGFAQGLGMTVMVFAAIIGLRAALGRRALADKDERECKIREKAAFVAFKLSLGLLAAFAVAAFALPALGSLPAGAVALGASQLILALYLGSVVVISRLM